jgi:DNA-binding SARP family transcriptional activator/tetratricopeptide (TPR) repeat protein
LAGDQLRYSVFGPVRAWRGDTELELGWPKQRAVLAMLLLNADRLVSQTAIIDGVWGEQAPASAVNLVHTYVSRLRRVLEPGQGPRTAGTLLARTPSGYMLRLGAGQLDLAELDLLLDRARQCRAARDLSGVAAAYDAALALCQAPPLAGIPGPVADTERARLAELHLTLVEGRAEALLELGGHHQLAGDLLALAAEHPLRERITALLMTALYHSGRQAEALSAYTRTRTLLAGELGIDPGPELQQLQLQILAGDPVPAGGNGAAAAAGLPVPRQLPADTPHFAGRAEHLRQLIAAMGAASGASGAVVISAIDGMGGVGKSALAIHGAHRLSDAGGFPDGQLYLNLQGDTPGLEPVDPLDALGRMLRALGVGVTQLPAGLDEAAALFRTLTAGKRLLLVLDNARDVAQVRPLVPAGPACRVLVTSRRILATLDLGGARPLHLDVLSEDEALDLLGRLVGPGRIEADREASATVVRSCGFLPLAVRIAAARLAARPRWPVGELAGRLADAARRLEELTVGDLGVRASFDVSLDALQHSPDVTERAAARAFTLLSLPDGPDIDATAAAAVLNESQRTARTLLERLVDAQLLQTPQPGRYRFHDLLRLHSRGRQASSHDPGADTQLPDAVTRMLRLYTATAWRTLMLLRPGDHRLDNAGPGWADAGLQFADVAAALSWLEAERANLMAAVAQAAGTPAIPASLALELTSALYGFFLVRGYWADGARANQIVLQLARRVGDRAAEAQASNDLGTFCRWLGRYQQALSHHRQSLALSRELGDRRGQARSLAGLGIVHWRLGRYEDAIACHQESLGLARELGDQRDQAGCLGNLGNVYELMGRHDEALICHQDSVDVFRRLGDHRALAGSLINLGDAYERLGRYQDATSCLHDSLRLFGELGERHGQALSLNNLGRVNHRLGRYQDAIACQRDSLRLFRELGERHGQAEALRDLGDVLAADGRIQQAWQAWQDALTIFQCLQVPEADHIRCRLGAAPPAAAPGADHAAAGGLSRSR